MWSLAGRRVLNLSYEKNGAWLYTLASVRYHVPRYASEHSYAHVRTHLGIWGFPKIRGNIMGGQITETRVYWGLHWGNPILGNYHMVISQNEGTPIWTPKYYN